MSVASNCKASGSGRKAARVKEAPAMMTPAAARAASKRRRVMVAIPARVCFYFRFAFIQSSRCRTSRYPSRSWKVRPCTFQYGLNGATGWKPAAIMRARCSPFGYRRHVEDSQVFHRGRGLHRMAAMPGDLQVVVGACGAEHDAVEPGMALEARNDAQAEPAAVHVGAASEVAHWPRDAQMTMH